MEDFWNLRYKQDGFAYGKEPNVYFKNALDKLSLTGKMLFPAEGEGRNAIYAAKMGVDVLAFDTSKEGRNKAIELSKEENVEIAYKVGELDQLNLKKNSVDAVVLIYAHFPANLKSELHRKLVELIKPEGYLIFEAFSKNHLSYRKKNPNVGGPDNLDMLFSKSEISNDFKDMKTIELKEAEVELNEGKHHIGLGHVVRYIGKKIK